jgi:hypothetical protein
MPENETKIVRKKLINITEDMDEEIKKRMRETHRTEMQVFRDAILFEMFDPRVVAALADYAEKQGKSRERALLQIVEEMWDYYIRSGRSKKR